MKTFQDFLVSTEFQETQAIHGGNDTLSIYLLSQEMQLKYIGFTAYAL